MDITCENQEKLEAYFREYWDMWKLVFLVDLNSEIEAAKISVTFVCSGGNFLVVGLKSFTLRRETVPMSTQFRLKGIL